MKGGVVVLSEEEFWRELYTDDAVGYEKHLKQQEATYRKLEQSEKLEREKLANLFSEKTFDEVSIHIKNLTRDELLSYRRQLIRMNRDVESRYHTLMDKDVFSTSIVRLNELISQSSWDDVKQIIMDHFTNNENMIVGFNQVYEELNRLDPIDNNESLVISLEYHKEEDGYSVTGLKPQDIEKYALDFAPWEEWLGYTVSQKDLELHGETMVIAHCLWEMTFDGFSQEEIKNSLNDLMARNEDTEK